MSELKEPAARDERQANEVKTTSWWCKGVCSEKIVIGAKPLKIFQNKTKTMQIKLFTIPVGDSGSALDEMNHFLKGNRILEVENHLLNIGDIE
ncbi:MAG: hypothetical protein GY941_02600 [Planctomycetes bacterium]|nr:hypothetical protein [Planctomycetota bacterium]